MQQHLVALRLVEDLVRQAVETASLQHQLRMLAVASLTRAPPMPDVTPLDELGLTGFDADAVLGLYAWAGTAQAVIERLNAEVNRLLNTSAAKERIDAMGNVPLPMSPVEFGRKVATDSQRMGALIRERRIQAD